MRKLIVTCECGQKLRVPQSAVGKTGACVSCGRIMQISPENTRRENGRKRRAAAAGNMRWQDWMGPKKDAVERFGRAVDSFNARHYAEAMAIFDSLASEFPNSPEIEQARVQCLEALHRQKVHALTFQPGAPSGEEKLDRETIEKVVLDKMLYGTSDEVRLNAARLAAEILGLIKAPAASPTPWDEMVRGSCESISKSTSSKTEGMV